MSLPTAGQPPALNPTSTAVTSVHDRVLIVARAACIAVMLLIIGSFILSLPDRLMALQTVCHQEDCPDWQLSAEAARAFEQVGLSIPRHAMIAVGLDVLLLSIYASIAAIIVRRRSTDTMALFAAVFLTVFGATLSPVTEAFDEHPSAWSLPLHYAAPAGTILLIIFLYIFPDGRFRPRWTRWLTAVLLVATLGSLLGSIAWSNGLSFLIWIILLLTGLGAQIYRFWRISGPVQRQQTKWVVFGLAAMSVGLIASALPDILFPDLDKLGGRAAISDLTSDVIAVLALLIFPISLGIAILRSRLWDIDVIINRSLVYGTLTAAVGGIYVIVTGSLGAMFQSRSTFLVSLTATGVVAVLFQPIHARVQRGINRVMYGERDEPYAVISRLGQRLEGILEPDAVPSTIAATITQALKLPYAAIALRQGDDLITAATLGTAGAAVTRFPLVYQNEPVGELVLAPRSGTDGFSPADRRLLDDLARQIGVAVHAVQLTQDLRRSRERLIVAREEERRRLRRDLHDGLGPELAGMSLQAEEVLDLIESDRERAGALQRDLIVQLQEATADIRRLVYELRPPALDDLGLAGALRSQAARYERSGLRITIDAPDHVQALPAALEVAAYRIIQEALTNVVRHARASVCSIQLTADDSLGVVVTDDGIGISPTHTRGVGLSSMRERAEELGGRCVMEAVPGGGTRVYATFPIRRPDTMDIPTNGVR